MMHVNGSFTHIQVEYKKSNIHLCMCVCVYKPTVIILCSVVSGIIIGYIVKLRIVFPKFDTIQIVLVDS